MQQKIKLLVTYDGGEFCGWQKQKNQHRPSLQETLEKAISQFFSQPIKIFGSGRTDAGVHALGQVCHFSGENLVEKLRGRDLCWAMNGMLPQSISVRQAWLASEDFHATLSATHKTYKYFVYNHPRSHPLLRNTTLWVRRPIDLEHLQASTNYLLGRHDFTSFQSAGTEVKTTVRTIYNAKWTRRAKNILVFTITGEGFLKQMVRNIVGTHLKLEKEQQDPSHFKYILDSCQRELAAAPAEAHGLFLWKVYYPDELDKKCRPL